MKISISILNNELFKSAVETVDSEATWYSRTKAYESETLDEDIINCTVSQYVDRVILEDIQLTNSNQVDDLIRFLENAKKSFR